MTLPKHLATAVLAASLFVNGVAVAQHGGNGGDVDTSALPDVPESQWLDENPYRGSKRAMRLGKAAYDGNCARCHGIDMISGGIAPDLRELGPQYDEYFLDRIRNGVQRNGVTYMPAFEGVLDQETMWAIRAYVDQRHYEYKDKDLDALYAQWDESHPGDNDQAETDGAGDKAAEQKAKTESADAASDKPRGADRITGGATFHIADDEPAEEDDAKDEKESEAADADDDSAAVAPAARAVRVADSGDTDRLAQIKRQGTIEVAVYRAFPPWSYESDTGVTGIDVDIGKALAERLGVSFALRSFTADETMGDDIRNQVWKGHYLGGGVADAMLHVGMARAFQQENDQATFVAPYYNETMGFAYNAQSLGVVDSPLALKGKKIGVQTDSLGDYFLTSAYQGQLRNDVEHFASVPSAMQALNEGRLAAVMAPVGELAGAVTRLDDRNVTLRTVKLTGMYQTDWDVGVAIQAGNPELAQAIRGTMQTMREDGTIESIFAKYGVPYRAPSDSAEGASVAATAITS